jgi:GNAT superfamily N-acetyltransferase
MLPQYQKLFALQKWNAGIGCSVFSFRISSFRRCSPKTFVDMLWVSENFRGQNFGTLLMAKVEDVARERKL